MKSLHAGMDPERFFQSLRTASSRVLLLDYDGTLAPFHEARDRAAPYPEARELVSRIQEQGRTRVVVVSGRAVESLLPLLGLDPPPEIWGSHGWERRRPDGTLEPASPSTTARSLLSEAAGRAARLAPEGRVEVKPASVAVHVRGLPPAEAEHIAGAVRAEWQALVRNAALEVHDFDGGVELRVSGHDKGSAVRAVLSEEPPDAAVAYLGDDLTDEDAFRTLRGRGLAVLVRSEPRESSADVWIRPPAEIIGFLRRWLEEAGRADRPAVSRRG